MNEKRIVKEAEKFMKNNIPASRSKDIQLRHVEGVRKYALLLADVYKADRFVIEVSALLHDVAADAGKNHAEKGAELARKFLTKFNVSADTIEKVVGCIRNHSMGSVAETIEQQIIQDADGISFLENNYIDFFEIQRKKSFLEEARKNTTEKTKGMMSKIRTEEGRKIAEKFLDKALKYLKNAVQTQAF